MFGGMFKVLLLLVVLFAVASAIVMGGIVYVTKSRLPVVPVVAGGITQVSVSETASREFDQKLQGFLEGTQAYNDEQVRKITLSQDEVTSKIVDMVRNGESLLPLNDIQINLQNDKILASGDLAVSGLLTKVAIVATLENENGKPTVKVENVDYGQLPVPQEVKDQINNAIASINLSSGSIPINLKSIRVENGQLVLEGTPK